LPALLGDRAAVVADGLLGVLGDLAGLAREPERGIGQPGLAWILGRTPGELLVLGELDAGDRTRRSPRKPLASAEFARSTQRA
jgi:hypothetical protein